MFMKDGWRFVSAVAYVTGAYSSFVAIFHHYWMNFSQLEIRNSDHGGRAV
jgi:hypothetical protein